MVFKQQIDQLVYAIDNNFNPTFNSKLLLSHEEIQHHIKSLSKGKHLFQISHKRTYYFCGNKTVDELCILFNSILRHAHVPEMFNVGKVISVFKGKAKIKVIVKIIEL